MLCIYTVPATKKVLDFAKQWGESKAREIADNIQWVARSTMLDEASKLLREEKNLA